MKKLSIILLVSIYSLSTLGIGISKFYCCGKLKSTSITFVQYSKEIYGKSNVMSCCCKTGFKSLKIKDSHVLADGISNPVKYFTNLHLFTPSFEVMTRANEPMNIA